MKPIHLFVISAMLAFSCHTNPVYCPTPEIVKLKKTKAKRFKYIMAKYKEEQSDNKDYFKESSIKTKELRKIEEWDCPKPGLKHDKMVQKKAIDLQRRYAKNLKKVAKDSEQRTVQYTNAETERN